MRLPFNLLACCPSPGTPSSPDLDGQWLDLRKICSLMLTGPRDLGFYYPMRFHKLGTYELRGRHAALFAANLRAIDNLSPRTASRLVHRLGESSTPQAWEQQHREFLANEGLAPGLEGDLYFISQELLANLLHACPPPFYSQETHGRSGWHLPHGLGHFFGRHGPRRCGCSSWFKLNSSKPTNTRKQR